jgi:L-asparaginase
MILKTNNHKLKVNKKLDNSVIILKLFPGIAEIVVKNALNITGLKGVILETYGAGNAPTDEWFIDALSEAITKGIIIYNVTQCKGGAVDMGKYETSMKLSEIGIIGGSDITTESAIAKMMYLLGQGYDTKEIIGLLQVSLRGELTV